MDEVRRRPTSFLERAEKREGIQRIAACPIVATKEANLVTARPPLSGFTRTDTDGLTQKSKGSSL